MAIRVTPPFTPALAPGVPGNDCPKRRKLQAELVAIKDLIKSENLNDDFSVTAAKWRDNFFKALRKTDDVDLVKKEFINLLKELLKDPVDAPLDEQALKGSDGHIYSSLTYRLYLAHAPQDIKDRSPLHPEDPTPFTVEPHALARCLATWLKQHNPPAPASNSAQEAFAQFERQSQDHAQKLQREAEAMLGEAQALNARAKKLEPRLNEIDKKLVQQAKLKRLKEKHQLQESKREKEKEVRAKRLQKEKIAAEEIEKLKKMYRQLQTDREKNDEEEALLHQRFAEEKAAMEKKIAVIRETIDLRDRENEALQGEIDKAKKGVEDVKRQHAEERLLIRQTEAIIQKNEEKAKSSLLWCAGALILGALVAAASQGGVLILPLNDGALAVTSVTL